MICIECAIAAKEVEQVGHLLKVGRDAWIVTQEMDVVELEINDMLDPLVSRIELARRRRGAAVQKSDRYNHRQTQECESRWFHGLSCLIQKSLWQASRS
jgi:hypothetical protein